MNNTDDLMMVLLKKIEDLETIIKKPQVECLMYNTKELAMAMGMSVNYANKLMNYPGFPAMKVGGNWKVSKIALEEWLDKNKRRKEIDLK